MKSAQLLNNPNIAACHRAMRSRRQPANPGLGGDVLDALAAQPHFTPLFAQAYMPQMLCGRLLKVNCQAQGRRFESNHPLQLPGPGWRWRVDLGHAMFAGEN
jgi:hypothetical protein